MKVPENTLKMVEKIQNISPKLILKHGKYDGCMDANYQLHWLPPRKKMTLNVSCIFHKCLCGNALQFLKDILKPTKLKCALRSEQKRYKLEVLQTKCETYGDSASGVYVMN